MQLSTKKKLKLYYFTTIFSVLFALIGFSYNTWRMEATEDNEIVRTASFEVLVHIAEFEQIVFAIHYDKDPEKGTPRDGWAKVGLFIDLCSMISSDAEKKALELKQVWQHQWPNVESSTDATNTVLKQVDRLRLQIKKDLQALS